MHRAAAMMGIIQLTLSRPTLAHDRVEVGLLTLTSSAPMVETSVREALLGDVNH
jgi:hypothetical protein